MDRQTPPVVKLNGSGPVFSLEALRPVSSNAMSPRPANSATEGCEKSTHHITLLLQPQGLASFFLGGTAGTGWSRCALPKVLPWPKMMGSNIASLGSPPVAARSGRRTQRHEIRPGASRPLQNLQTTEAGGLLSNMVWGEYCVLKAWDIYRHFLLAEIKVCKWISILACSGFARSIFIQRIFKALGDSLGC